MELKGLRLRADKTKPPAPHTEASLLAAMEHAEKMVIEDSEDDKEEEFGIGTPATRAATIEKMIDKEMAVRKGRTLIPTEYGIKLISILPEVLRSPEMTGAWEAKLARISKGEESPQIFMEEIRGLTRDVVNHAVELGDTGIENARSVGPCPLCGSAVREYEWAYYCVNKSCGFRKIVKAKFGFHPTLHSITMRELLANGSAVTEKGTYKLIGSSPYISFERAPKPVPDYPALKSLIEDYGLERVDKVPYGGALWVAGEKNDELMNDFARDTREIGCLFDFAADSKALGHNSGWCHRVDPEYREAYAKAFGVTIMPELVPPINTIVDEEKIFKLIQDAGFEYADKRKNGGSLWIIAGEEEGKALIDAIGKLGMKFAFTEKGGRSSGNRPAWYSVKSH